MKFIVLACFIILALGTRSHYTHRVKSSDLGEQQEALYLQVAADLDSFFHEDEQEAHFR